MNSIGNFIQMLWLKAEETILCVAGIQVDAEETDENNTFYFINNSTISLNYFVFVADEEA